MLIAALSACLLAVVVIAVLTVTVISDDGNGGTRVVVMQPTPAAGPGPQGLGPGRGAQVPRFRLGPAPLRTCLQKQGLLPRSPGSPPDPQKLQDALKACLGSAPTLQPPPAPGSKGAKTAPVPTG